MNRKDLAIIIPAYNEEQTIGQVVRSALPHGHVFVVNDNSSDQTESVALESGAKVITQSKNLGYDSALQRGFEEAAKEESISYFLTMDADGQHSSDLIETFYKLLSEKFDLVLGKRPEPARFGEKTFAAITKIRFGINDPLCGMKAYSRRLYEDLGHFDSYQSIGTELALFGLKKKYKFIELPVPIAPRKDQPRFGQAFRANKKIFRAISKSAKYLRF